MEVWTKEAVKGVALLVRTQFHSSHEGSNYAARTKNPDDDCLFFRPTVQVLFQLGQQPEQCFRTIEGFVSRVAYNRGENNSTRSRWAS